MSKTRERAPRKLTTTEIAQMADVHPRTVRRWIAEGRLRPSRTLGGHYRFDEEAARTLRKLARTDESEEPGSPG